MLLEIKENLKKVRNNRKLLLTLVFVSVFLTGVAIGTILSNKMSGHISTIYGIGDVTITNIAGPDVIVINNTFFINVTFQNNNDFEVGIQVVFNFTFNGVTQVTNTSIIFEQHNGTLTPNAINTEYSIDAVGNIDMVFVPGSYSMHAILLPANSIVTISFAFHTTIDAQSIDYQVWAVAPPQ